MRRWSPTLCLMICACASSQHTVQPIVFDACLWQASRETVGFARLNKSDPVNGIIETEWEIPAGEPSNNSYQIIVHLDYSRIYKDAVHVDIHHKFNNFDLGDDPLMASAFEKAIAARAGELRVEQNALKQPS